MVRVTRRTTAHSHRVLVVIHVDAGIDPQALKDLEHDACVLSREPAVMESVTSGEVEPQCAVQDDGRWSEAQLCERRLGRTDPASSGNEHRDPGVDDARDRAPSPRGNLGRDVPERPVEVGHHELHVHRQVPL